MDAKPKVAVLDEDSLKFIPLAEAIQREHNA